MGIGNYTGSVKKEFAVTVQDLSKLSMTAGDVQYSTKKDKVKSVPVIKDLDGKSLKS